MNRQITILVFAVVISLAIGYFAAGVGMGTQGVMVGDNTFEKGWEAAEKRLAETGFAPMNIEGLESKSVFGDVQEIKNDSIYVKIIPMSPLSDPELDIRIVKIGDTKIYQLTEKDFEQFDKEMQEFNKKLEAQQEKLLDNPDASFEPIDVPESFNKQEVGLDYIEVGQQVSVVAGEDITDKKEFVAKEIMIQFVSELIDEGLLESSGE
ncbi:MAG: hypothetical protein K9M15_01260 [Candidatus Marinimicrobia bacterium]|nr:hypothetical protein [Candidatus Neomarinimicrobiota bacterium]